MIYKTYVILHRIYAILVLGEFRCNNESLYVEPGTVFLAMDIPSHELVGEDHFEFIPEPDVMEYEHFFVYALISVEPDEEELPVDEEEPPIEEEEPPVDEEEPPVEEEEEAPPAEDEDEEAESETPPRREAERERDSWFDRERRSTRYIPGVHEPEIRVNTTYTPRPLPIIPDYPLLFNQQEQGYHFVQPSHFQETFTYFVSNLDVNAREKNKLVVVPFIATEQQSKFFISKEQLESLVMGQRNMLITDGNIGLLLEPHFITTLQDIALFVSATDGVYSITSNHHEALNLIFLPTANTTAGAFSTVWYREHSGVKGYAVSPTQFVPDSTMVVWLEKSGEYTRNSQGF